VPEVLRRPVDDPAGRLFNGVWYESEADYQAARRKEQERRARLLARMSVEEGGELMTLPSIPVEAVRHYAEQLKPFWSAKDGWRYYEDQHLKPFWPAERGGDDVSDGLGKHSFIPPRPAR
jgi:hypothetical protein